MHLMHPLDKPGWGTGEGESQADASVWLLQRLTCSIPHTGSQQRQPWKYLEDWDRRSQTGSGS